MDRQALTVLRGRLAAVLVAVDQALESLERRCFDCHRRSADLAQCGDGEWRGPKCRSVWEAGAGEQLPIGGEARG